MRSLLTPLLCRRILLNEPIVHKGCIFKPVRNKFGKFGPIAHSQSSRTLFWGASGRHIRDKDHDVPPGLGEFVNLSREKQPNFTSETHTDLVNALNSFFHWQAQSRKPLSRSYAEHAWNTVQYLSTRPEFRRKQWLSTKSISRALQVLERTSLDVNELHEKLAEELLRMLLFADKSKSSQSLSLEAEALHTLLKLMAHNGKAIDSQLSHCVKLEKHIDNRASSQKFWHGVLYEYAKSGNEAKLLKALSQIECLNLQLSREMYDVLIQYYATHDNVEKARNWYKQSVQADNKSITAATYSAILRCCSRTGEIEWGNSIARSIAEGDVSKEVWDAIFIWAAATGKGVEEVDRLMDLMTKRSQDGLGLQPDSITINQLIEHSVNRNDPYSAERFLYLGKRRDIQPNTETYTLQIIYRMAINDLDGALGATKGLQSEITWSGKSSSAINELVQKMCKSRKNDFHTIMDLVEQLSARKCPLKAKTVLGLCILHLARNELHEVIDLLKTYSFDYSAEERIPIRDVLVSFCLNPINSTSQAWDTYMVCRHTFDTEATRDIREQIMHAFFQRGRPDMACYVFGHMRRHPRPEIRPTANTYIAFFEGVAACRDGETLEVVHSQLKLDATIDPNTRLLNALMLAYTRCDMANRSIEFWDEIVASREGPSYDSIRLIFQACERSQFGDRRAKRIWGKLIGMEISIPNHVFAAYVGAIASHSRLEDALQLIEMGVGIFGHAPNVLMSVKSTRFFN